MELPLLSVTSGQCNARHMLTLPACAGTHCAYPWRDGQAEFTGVTYYVLRWLSIPALIGLNIEKVC